MFVAFCEQAGEIMNAGGLSRRLIRLAMTLIGHVHGGLGYVTIVAAVLMAARSAGLIASPGIIAPSIGFIILGVTANISIARLFMAGIAPGLMPLVREAGIDPVYFGVLFMINCSIGLITPPVGMVLNTVASVGKLRIEQVARGVAPFMIVQFLLMFLLIAFPSLVMVPVAGRSRIQIKGQATTRDPEAPSRKVPWREGNPPSTVYGEPHPL